MSGLPNGSVQDGLAARIEGQDAHYMRICADLQRELFPPSDATHLDVAGGSVIYVDRESPLTKAIGIGMAGPVTPRDFDVIEDFFRSRGGIVRVDLCPYADPTTLHELALRGYRPGDWKNIFIRNVIADDAAFDPPHDIEIREVQKSDLGAWVEIVSDGFNPVPGQPNPHESLYHVLGAVPGNVLFMAAIDGEPAGAACLGVEGELASFVSTSVRTKFRRRGVHSALLRARLRWLARRDVRTVRIAATPGSDSERNIERFGFRPLYSRLVLWRDLAAA